MLTYSFENTGSDSLYEYLYKCIKNDILKGNLIPGYKLPSKRSFAKNLGISTITIENAYEQLIAEGYIYSVPKKGYYVCDISNVQHELSKSDDDNFSITYKVPESMNEYNSKKIYPYNLASNHTNANNFPFFTWTKLMKDIIADRSDDLLTPSPVGGVAELRYAIAKHLAEFRGMNVSPEQIIVGAGTEYLYGLLIILLGRDKIFAVEDPGYPKIELIYKSNNVKCSCIGLDNEGIDVKALEDSGSDILHLSPSHHFPTGIVTPISRRYEILGWASKKNSRYIIEDDYDSEFRLLGKPIPSLQSIDVSDKVIYMNTFTKSLMPTIRISYMVLPFRLLELFKEKLGFYSCTVSNFEQYTLAKFISEGHFEKHINRMRIFYRNQRDELITEIEKSPLSKLVTIQEENAGLHFLMTVDTDLTDEELIKRAEDKGLKIRCLSQYYVNKNNAQMHTLVINYSGISVENISKAVQILYECVR